MDFPTDYLGCADELPKDDPRQPNYAEQRATRGWDQTEIWNLDVTTVKFIVSRLTEFRSYAHGHEELIDSILTDLDIDWDEYYLPGFDATAMQRGLRNYFENVRSFWV